MIIYKITNIITNKIYIGQTVQSLIKRWQDHCSTISGCIKLKNAIQKYGKENFTIEIIEKCSNINELNKREEYWIAELNAIENGYNLTTGGMNFLHSKETKEKLSKMAKKQFQCVKQIKIAKNNAINNWKNKKYRKKIEKIFSDPTFLKKKKEKELKRVSRSFNVYKAICKTKKINRFSKVIYKKGKLIGVWENKSICAEDLNIDFRNISSCLSRKRPQYRGYIFEYIK